MLLDIKDFLRELLGKDVEIVGFDVKLDLKRLWYYIDHFEPKKSKEELAGQTSLF